MMQQTALTSWSERSPPPEKWVAFYVRVTREESVKADLSIPNQIARAKEVASLRKWPHWKVYVEPKHVSGELWLNKRPALRELVQDVNAGHVTAVCARHTDRLWRTSEIQSQLISILRERSVEVWDFSQRHEYKTAHGRFSLQVLGAAAELEVNLTAERIREMKRGKARKGKTGGGPPPFGYTSQSRRLGQLLQAGYDQDEAYAKACTEFPVGKRWFIDEEEATVVRLIFEQYTAPKSRLGSKRIARHLNSLGYKTRTGMAWLAPYIRRMVANPAYAGYTTYDEDSYEKRLDSRLPRDRQTLYKGEHEPLISLATWQKAQNDRKEGITIKRDGRQASERRVFALTGILRCPSCGSRMIGKWSRHSTRTYYLCARRHNGGPELCSFPMLDANQLHRETWRWVHTIISSPEYLDEHLKRLQDRLQRQRPEAEKNLDRAKRRMDEIRGSLRKYYMLLEGSHDPIKEQAFTERITELRGELASLETEVGALQRQVSPTQKPPVTLIQMQAYLQQFEERGADKPEIQKAIFHELRRNHGFAVRATTNGEIVLSIDLTPAPASSSAQRSNLTSPSIRRFYSVVDATGSAGGSRGSGFPDPGGPTNSRLCPPAAAISSARRAVSCPRISLISAVAACSSAASLAGAVAGSTGASPLKVAMSSFRLFTGNTAVSPPATAASAALSRGTYIRRNPRRRAQAAIGSTPRTARTRPSSASSPTNRDSCAQSSGNNPDPVRIPTAIGRSYAAPSLRMSAGARFTVTFRGGSLDPMFSSAPRIRVRPSFTPASGNPTIENPGNPPATSTSTSMGDASTPTTAAERTRVSMRGGHCQRDASVAPRRFRGNARAPGWGRPPAGSLSRHPVVPTGSRWLGNHNHRITLARRNRSLPNEAPSALEAARFTTIVGLPSTANTPRDRPRATCSWRLPMVTTCRRRASSAMAGSSSSRPGTTYSTSTPRVSSAEASAPAVV